MIICLMWYIGNGIYWVIVIICMGVDHFNMSDIIYNNMSDVLYWKWYLLGNRYNMYWCWPFYYV